MMQCKKIPLLLLAAVLAPGAVAAQAEAPVMKSVRPGYESAKNYLLRTAEQLSEEDFEFRPTADVRTVREQLGHIADTQHLYCSVALGESTPHETDLESTRTTRDAMIQALRESFEYCDTAYAQSDAEALQPVAVWGGQRSRLSVLIGNAVHNWEHYGNLVTYMRMLGQVPPSSQPRS